MMNVYVGQILTVERLGEPPSRFVVTHVEPSRDDPSQMTFKARPIEEAEAGAAPENEDT